MFFDEYIPQKKLYLAEVLTYSNFKPIKVGVSKNPHHRMKQLRSMGIHLPQLLGYYEFPTTKDSFLAEAAILRQFKPRPGYDPFLTKEVIDATFKELHSFIIKLEPLRFISAGR